MCVRYNMEHEKAQFSCMCVRYNMENEKAQFSCMRVRYNMEHEKAQCSCMCVRYSMDHEKAQCSCMCVRHNMEHEKAQCSCMCVRYNMEHEKAQFSRMCVRHNMEHEKAQFSCMCVRLYGRTWMNFRRKLCTYNKNHNICLHVVFDLKKVKTVLYNNKTASVYVYCVIIWKEIAFFYWSTCTALIQLCSLLKTYAWSYFTFYKVFEWLLRAKHAWWTIFHLWATFLTPKRVNTVCQPFQCSGNSTILSHRID